MNPRFPASAGLLSVLALCLSGCLTDDGEYKTTHAYAYRPGLSVKDSTVVHAYTYPDTAYDTAVVLREYEAPDSMTFTYEHVTTAPRNVADGGGSSKVSFVVPLNAVNFRLSGPGKVFFQSSCYGACGVRTVTDALISGHANGNGKYTVEGTVIHRAGRVIGREPDIDTTYREALHFKGTFRRAK